MEILDVISAKLNLAQRVARELVDNYKMMEDAERLEKANTILDQVNSYLQIEGNLIFPFIRKNGECDDLLERARNVHQEIETLTEHAIMMHVDEPSGEFYNDMRRLIDLLDVARKTDQQAIFPWANAYLSEEDQLYVASKMKNQMTHESLPSSGMTIY